MSAQISKKRKFVADGVFRAELNEFFTRELSEEGYSGCDVRVTHARTEVCMFLPSTVGGQQFHHFIDYRSCYAYSRGPRREGPPYSRAYCPRSETIQVS
jgi:hypothetical protein